MPRQCPVPPKGDDVDREFKPALIVELVVELVETLSRHTATLTVGRRNPLRP